MEDMAWVLYALLGTQVILIVVGLWCHNALVGVATTISLISLRRKDNELAEALQSIRRDVYEMRARLSVSRPDFDDLE